MKRREQKELNPVISQTKAQCCKCGKNLNNGSHMDPYRLKLRLCGVCFRKFVAMKGKVDAGSFVGLGTV